MMLLHVFGVIALVVCGLLVVSLFIVAIGTVSRERAAAMPEPAHDAEEADDGEDDEFRRAPDLELVRTQAMFQEISRRNPGVILLLFMDPIETPEGQLVHVKCLHHGIADLPAALKSSMDLLADGQSREITEDDV